MPHLRRSTALAALIVLLAATACSTSTTTTGAPSSASDSPHLRVPAVPAADPGSPWPTALHDVGHSGRSSAAGPTTGAVRWVRQLEGNVTPGPVVGADGTIYLATNSGTLHALDPATGADRWTVAGPGASGTDLSSSPAILRGGTIAWSTAGSTLQGIAPDGSRRWSVDLPSTGTSPMPFGDRVYVMSTDGSLTAVRISDDERYAEVVWTRSLGAGSYASVAIRTDGAIATNTDTDLVLVRDDGDHPTELWRADLGVLSEISPAVDADGTVVSGGNDDRIQVFSPTGARLRTFDRETQSYSSPVLTDGVVVQGNHRAAIVAADLRSGERRVVIRRRVKQPGRDTGIWTAPVLDREANVYFGTRSGRIIGVSWSGTLLFDINAGDDATVDSYPALTADGALIVGDTNGVVRAIADDGALPSDAGPR